MEKTKKSQAFPKHLQVDILNNQKDLSLKKILVKKAVGACLDYLKIFPSQVSIYFVTEKKIAELHKQFFDDSTPTDCISFPLDDTHLGEVFVCPSIAIKYGKKHRVDPFEEILLYIVHGLLHLIGYDDIKSNQRKRMRSMEKKCMHHLRTKGMSLAPTFD